MGQRTEVERIASNGRLARAHVNLLPLDMRLDLVVTRLGHLEDLIVRVQRRGERAHGDAQKAERVEQTQHFVFWLNEEPSPPAGRSKITNQQTTDTTFPLPNASTSPPRRDRRASMARTDLHSLCCI